MHRLFIYLILACISFTVLEAEEIATIRDLSYVDTQYNILYQSTIASKNRILKKIRKEKYSVPRIFRYTLKKGEDIWTLIAKTSLNIDTIATLNRLDFIGMLREGSEVYLSDTLGIFLPRDKHDELEIIDKYPVREEEILSVSDPLNSEDTLFFVPEVQLSFLERTYITGVVFYAPLMGIETSKFGPRVDPFINELAFHGGVDITADEGKNVHAARWGTVIYVGEQGGYGNLIIIAHQLGYHSLYGHLEEILVELEENVESGQVIGTVGKTGRTTGPHLHFEIRRFDDNLNPDNIPFFLIHK